MPAGATRKTVLKTGPEAQWRSRNMPAGATRKTVFKDRLGNEVDEP